MDTDVVRPSSRDPAAPASVLTERGFHEVLSRAQASRTGPAPYAAPQNPAQSRRLS